MTVDEREGALAPSLREDTAEDGCAPSLEGEGGAAKTPPWRGAGFLLHRVSITSIRECPRAG